LLLFVATLLVPLLRRGFVALALPALAGATLLLQPTAIGPVAVGAIVAVAALLGALVYRGGLVALVAFLGSAAVLLLSAPAQLGGWIWPYHAAGPLLVAVLVALGARLAWRGAPSARKHATDELDASTVRRAEAPTQIVPASSEAPTARR
jgi:hypothetical protein